VRIWTQADIKTDKNKKKKEVIFTRAEKYVKEYREAEKEKVRLSRDAKQSGSFYVPAESKLAFVVRIKGINKIDPKKRKTLQLLRLLQINNGVFIRLTKATSEMLKSEFSHNDVQVPVLIVNQSLSPLLPMVTLTKSLYVNSSTSEDTERSTSSVCR